MYLENSMFQSYFVYDKSHVDWSLRSNLDISGKGPVTSSLNVVVSPQMSTWEVSISVSGNAMPWLKVLHCISVHIHGRDGTAQCNRPQETASLPIHNLQYCYFYKWHYDFHTHKDTSGAKTAHLVYWYSLALELMQPPVQQVLWLKWLENQADHSPSSSANIMNEWSYISIPICPCGAYRDNFTFTMACLHNLQ
jgi:hypothetical protein